ncbi:MULTISPECIES: hypothetical protein [unclassified Streptomyces]|uniref:hypothetical protein n=1 Tax=unclassified Streptomyces TaxID=2593676 RepID=UPI000939A22B|nr:hypothetical protein [Streptomyces sp. CB01580]
MRAVAHDLRTIAQQLPEDQPSRALADLILEDTERRLTAPLCGTVRCAQGRALLVRTLYGRLDRLTEATARRDRATAQPIEPGDAGPQ